MKMKMNMLNLNDDQPKNVCELSERILAKLEIVRWNINSHSKSIKDNLHMKYDDWAVYHEKIEQTEEAIKDIEKMVNNFVDKINCSKGM